MAEKDFQTNLVAPILFGDRIFHIWATSCCLFHVMQSFFVMI